MPAVAVQQISTAPGLACAFAIRRTVFVEEQGVGMALEFDGLDDAARHLLAIVDGEPAGTLRIRRLAAGRIAKIERVAVLAPQRRHRVGRALMTAALDLARGEGANEAKVHAQVAVQGFYASLGFVAFGGPFEEDGIAHVAMRLPLTRSAGGP
jgi:predicted GNAT family N-acyltransferase